MNVLINPDAIFDTQVDTKKIFVSMKYKFEPHNYIDKEGKSLLYLHVWEKYPPTKISLDIYIERKYWDFKTKRVTKAHPGHVDLNLTIDHTEAKITDIKVRYRLSQTVLTIEKFMEEFYHGMPRIDFVKYFLYAKEKDFSLGKICFTTWKKENSVYKRFAEFKPKLLFSEFTPEDLDRFKLWRKERKISSTTINSNLRVLKKYIGRAADDGIKMKFDKKVIKVGSTNGSREALSKKELRKFMKYFKSGFLRDNHQVPLARFLFSCFTGIRIGDNQAMTLNDFNEGKILFTAEKTSKKNMLKLNKTAKKILKKCPEIFSTTYTDQHINLILKDIAKLLGVKTHVTFHVSRHTFATNFLEAGGDIQVLQKLLDHESIETTMIYAHVNQKEKDKQIMLLDKIK